MDKAVIRSIRVAQSFIKSNRTSVELSTEKEFEIQQCRLPPRAIQKWEKNDKEMIIVTQGSVRVQWKENVSEKTETLSEGASLYVKHSCALSNIGDSDAEFVSFRVLPKEDQ